MSVRVLAGDCLELLPTLDGDSVDACVTDPPYHLTSIVKRFGSSSAAPPLDYEGGSGVYKRASAGFMGKVWDGGDIAFRPDVWREVLRVLKPGGHLVAFGGSRTYHRLACAIEDAGFEIRDQIMWIYGAGFPKSLDVSKAIDRAAGVEREVVGRREYAGGHIQNSSADKLAPPIGTFVRAQDDRFVTAPATDAARKWQGFGTALKPAHEPIVLARKPLIGTVAANVLAHGTGALNIDGCRVESGGEHFRAAVNGRRGGMTEADERKAAALGMFQPGKSFDPTNSALGRWPANVIHDGSDEVVGAFPDTDPSSDATRGNKATTQFGFGNGRPEGRLSNGYSDCGGSAARFFYSAKADKDDRLSSKHPTVKPVDLMAYLCRLVCPPGGLVLDPFAGSGATGMACMREGFDAILIEREAEYVADIKRRIAHVSGKDAPLFAGAAE